MDKSVFLQTLYNHHRAWERLLAKISPTRMTLPGAAGPWSVKDILAHVTAREAALVELLEAHLSGADLPRPSDLEKRDAHANAPDQDRPLEDIQQEAGQVFNRLVAALEQLDDADLDDPQRTAALTIAVCGQALPLWQVVSGETCEHYRQHFPALHAWIALERSPYQTLRSLRAVRHFIDDPIPEDTLTRILQAGRWTGSSKNIQPWQFVVVRERARLAELSGCGRFAGHLRGAALAVVLVMEPNYISGFDAGRAAQNMMLAAWAEGIGSCIASMHDEACARRILSVPEDRQIQIAISFGYPDPLAEDTIDGKPRSAVLGHLGRKALEELVHYETWPFFEESETL